LRVAVPALLALFVGGLATAGAAYGQSGDDCGFFFCEPEAWLSEQNAVHLVSGYALEVTLAELNDSPWKNFVWLSVVGLGIETFQGALLEHPLHGGFSYKNVIFNEIGLLAGVAAHHLFSGERTQAAPAGESLPAYRVSSNYSSAPPLRYVRSCRCYKGGDLPSFSAVPADSAGMAVASLLKPAVYARYAVATR